MHVESLSNILLSNEEVIYTETNKEESLSKPLAMNYLQQCSHEPRFLVKATRSNKL